MYANICAHVCSCVFHLTSVTVRVMYVSMFRSCGIKEPSWSEIQHFLCFLDIQLELCERSVFCTSVAGEELAGLKGFAVKIMIQMSMVSLASHKILYLIRN